MDRSFSIASSSTGTGALRQYHQQQQHYQTNVRNSISPSSSTIVPHYQDYHHPHHLHHTNPTVNTAPAVVVKAQSPAAFSVGFGQEGHLAQVGYPEVAAGSIQNLVSSGGSVGGYFGVSSQNLSVQQQQHQTQQQQAQAYYQGQRTPNNFVPVSNSNPSASEVSYGQQSGGGGAGYNRIRSDHSPHSHSPSQPLRVNTGSRSNCGQQPDRSSSNHQQAHHHQQHQIQPSSNYSGNNSHSATVTSNNYSYNKVGDGSHYLHRQQCSSVSQEQYHQSSSSSPSVPSFGQMSNNHHHQNSQSNQQNMNKNRYGSQQPQQTPTSISSNVIVPQSASPGENINSQAAANKLLIQQMSQVNLQQHQNQKQQQNNEISPPQPQQQQAHPQYRIFKRGDSIPGISSPIQISTTSHSSVPTGVTGDNPNASPLGPGNDNSNLNGLGDNAENEANNGGSDKENNSILNSISSPPSGNANNSNANNGGNGNGARTPLSHIGEIARFHSLNVSYRLVKETGPPHAPTFTVLLQLGNEEYTGEGASIKKAQHAAATEALEKTTLQRPPPKAKSKKPYSVGGVGGGAGGKRPNWALIQLTNLAQELQLPLQFNQQPVPIVDPFRRVDPPSIVCVHVGDRIFSGEGSNFNCAKNTAVMVALKAMLKVKQEADMTKLAQAGADAEQSMMDAENKSPISIVHEMAMKRGLTVSFSIVQESGPPHMKVFTVNCKVGEELETEGQGPTKQAAKKTSSESMIAKLKEIPITLPATSQGLNLKAMQRGLLRQKSAKKKTSTPVLKDLEKQAVSPISRLIQIAHVKKFKEPEFTLISTGTESNVENFLKQITERDRRMLKKKKPIFTIEATVGPHACQGSGPNKKAAKKAAAEAAIIALGYGPTEDPSSDDAVDSSQQSTEQSPSQVKSKSGSKSNREGKTGSSTVKLAGAKQIAPGIIVLKSEPIAGAATSAAAVQEMKKVGSMMTPCPAASTREGIDKLAYLSKLLEISVSYSDFPKKNEYLSVVSLTTNPPHVAHGCGATLEEAQNAAALKILEELSTKGLDSVTAAAEKPSDS